MTFLLLALAALYAASMCFVTVLLVRTVWRERGASLDTVVAESTSATNFEATARTGAGTAAKSA